MEPETKDLPMSALSGVRVVELARILAGPWIGQTLADLGADVIKVESPEGDDTRRWGPPFIDTDGERTARLLSFLQPRQARHRRRPVDRARDGRSRGGWRCAPTC